MNLKERKAIIAGNWKLNKRVSEIPAFTQRAAGESSRRALL